MSGAYVPGLRESVIAAGDSGKVDGDESFGGLTGGLGSQEEVLFRHFC